MIQSSRSYRSRVLVLLSFLLALVFSLAGAAPLINNTLYTHNKIFLSWFLIDFQSDNQWIFPIFVWVIAGGFLLFGIIYRRRTTNIRPIEFNQSETIRKTWIPSPTIRKLLPISITVYLVLVCFLCLNTLGSQLGGPFFAVYQQNLSYQGHAYLLSVAINQQPNAPQFKFEVSQCDASGWFCHVIYDASQDIHTRIVGSVSPFESIANLVDAHLQTDAPHQ